MFIFFVNPNYFLINFKNVEVVTIYAVSIKGKQGYLKFES